MLVASADEIETAPEPQRQIDIVTPLNSMSSTQSAASDIVETTLQDEEHRKMDLYFQNSANLVQTTNLTTDSSKNLKCGEPAVVLKETLLNNIDVKSNFVGGKYFLKKTIL